MPAKTSNEFTRHAPYAPWSTFRDKVLNRRIRELKPRSVTVAVLRDEWEVGARSSCDKHHSALVFLGIVERDGSPCEETWSALLASRDTEYRQALGKVVEEAYAAVFGAVEDVKSVDDDLLEDVIGAEYGVAKTSRRTAVGFFKGICREAGIEVGPEEQAKEGEHKNRRKKAPPEGKPRGEALPAAGSPVAFQIVVDPTASEDELVELFRRAQAAWRKASESD